METLHWTEGVLPVLDFETTGVDPRDARIVSAALVLTTPRGKLLSASYAAIVDPGIEIPAEAAAIHGVTTEKARAEGVRPLDALGRLTKRIRGIYDLDLPLLIYNAPFDWPLLLAECERNGFDVDEDVPPLTLIDPLVFDRHFNRYRKGGKRLEAACQHYGVALDQAHDAHADAIATAELFRAMVRAHPELRDWTFEQYHTNQRAMHAAWVRDMNDFFARKGRTDRIEDDPWPGLDRFRAAVAAS